MILVLKSSMKSDSLQVDLSYWFGNGVDTVLSVMFFAFVPKQNTVSISGRVVEFDSDNN